MTQRDSVRPAIALPRPELHDVLTAVVAGRTGGKVLVCAPAGTGKTTLLVDWLGLPAGRPGGVPSAWITLADSDNDPAVLECRLHGAVRSLLPAGHDDPASVEETLGAVARAGRAVVLVLDDAHVLDDAAALGRLTEIVDAAPPNLALVVATRRTPDLPWVAYAAHGCLTVIGREQLALDRAAVTQILAEQRCVLSDSDLDTLLWLTGGWAVPVRLAAVRLSAHGDTGAGVAEILRAPSPIAGVVLDELLADLPGDLSDFLRATSVVDEFTQPLAECLSDIDFDRALALRERYCVPLTRSTDARGELTYAWHPLLLGYLRTVMLRGEPAACARSHRIAGDWFAERGERLTALRHLIAAASIDAAEEAAVDDFLQHHGMALVFEGHVQALLNVLGPDRADRRIVRLLQALAAFEDGDPATAEAILAVLPTSEPDPRPLVERTLEVALALEAGVASGLPLSAESVAAVESAPATGCVDMDGYVTTLRASVLLLRGDPVGCERLLAQALACAELGAHSWLTLRCLSRLAAVAAFAGDLDTMRVRADHALRQAEEHGLLDRIDAYHSAALLCLGLYLRGEKLPEDGPIYSQVSAMTLAPQRDGTHAPIAGWHVKVAFGLVRTGPASPPSVAVADALAKDLTRLFDLRPRPGVADPFLPPVVGVLLQARHERPAEEVVGHAAAVLGDVPEVHVSRAMIALARDDTAAAREHVGEALASGRLRATAAVRAHLLDAIAARREGRDLDAADSFLRSLDLAEPDRIVRPYLDHGSDAAELLVCAAAARAHPFADPVQSVLAEVFATRSPALTRTERVVLAHLATDEPLRTIAQQLHVSLNTVRTHTRNLYRKLDATSRAEALANARQRGLL